MPLANRCCVFQAETLLTSICSGSFLLWPHAPVRPSCGSVMSKRSKIGSRINLHRSPSRYRRNSKEVAVAGRLMTQPSRCTRYRTKVRPILLIAKLLVGSLMHAFDWCRDRRPWMTLNGCLGLYKLRVLRRSDHRNLKEVRPILLTLVAISLETEGEINHDTHALHSSSSADTSCPHNVGILQLCAVCIDFALVYAG